MTAHTTVNLERKRPFSLPLLLIFLFLGSVALLIGSAALVITHTVLDQVILLLAQLSWRLVPLPLWLGATLIVAAWLLLLRRAWASGL